MTTPNNREALTPLQQQAQLRVIRLTELRDEIADILGDDADCESAKGCRIADRILAMLSEQGALI